MLEARLTTEGRADSLTLTGPGPWLIGRIARADLSFPDDRSCSREQARIVRVEDGFALEHLSETTPTSLDGENVEADAMLHDGARIAFGVQRVMFTLIEADFGETTMMARAGPGRVVLKTQPPDRLILDRSLTVGRQEHAGQVVFDHPSVSRRHAAFDVSDRLVAVRDLGSTNGTYVNGVRIDRPRWLEENDRIDIGPFQLSFAGGALTSVSRSGNAALTVTSVGSDVRAGRGQVRILDGATFEILPREFVCIIGASGSGKSTLMNILAGRALPSSGTVKLNGVNLHAAFEALKQDIAFVPQQDVLHEQLTLRQALDFAARLRLPRDTSAIQRKDIVETAARSVDLFERLDTRIARLSGGQKKRASLASEILNRPSLLFLDEVTSGLDESTDAEIMRLLRRLADEGMTIVVVTHTLANIETFCHKVVCMGRGGHTTFVGAPQDALSFFGVARLGEIFNRIEDGGVLAWRARFEEAGLMTALAPGAIDPSAPLEPLPRKRLGMARRIRVATSQLAILVHRNVRLQLADRRALAMAAVQSVLIGSLMGYAFGSFGTGQEAVNGKNALLFLLGLTSIWLGCNAAATDIVGELVIYRRERDINLSTAAFVAAKFLVTGCFTVLQLAVVFVLTAVLAEHLPGSPAVQFGILILGGLAGTSIGLLISALSNTRDQATTIVPLALVPQIILAGILVPHLPAPATLFAKIAVTSFWLTEAMKSAFIAADGPIQVISATTGRLVAMKAEPTALGASIVALHAASFLLLGYVCALIRHGSRSARRSGLFNTLRFQGKRPRPDRDG